MRYLLYLTTDEKGLEIQYLISRKNEFWMVPRGHFHCPVVHSYIDYHKDTLIDGELVVDQKPGGGTEAKYLVFDCMVLDNSSLMNRTLDKRLAYFKERVFEPYIQLLRNYPEEIPEQHFIMELKSMEFSYAIEKMFNEVLPSLPHGNDGLIFTCRTSEYKFGTDPNILKWKPETENSIDFRLSMEFPILKPDEIDISEGITEPYYDYDTIPTCNLYAFAGDDSEDPWYGTMFIEPDEWESLKMLNQPLNDRIVECIMDNQARWRYMRFRDDKTHANHTSTVASVIESIKDRVTSQDLMSAAPRIREKWKQRDEEQSNRQGKEAERKNTSSVDSSNKISAGMKRKAGQHDSRQSSNFVPNRISNI